MFQTFLSLVLFSAAVFGAEPGGVASRKEATTQTDEDWVDDRWSKTEVGRFLGACIETPRRKTPKGIAIKVGANSEGTVCFDTDLLRYSAGWTGGFLKLLPQRYGLISAPGPEGVIQFSSAGAPGVAKEGSFEDPRSPKAGPLPRSWGRYEGLYAHGERVVLKWSAGGLQVYESPWIENAGGLQVFTRSFEVRGEGRALLQLCDEPGATSSINDIAGIRVAILRKGSDQWMAAAQRDDVSIAVAGNSLRAEISGGARARIFLVKSEDVKGFAQFVSLHKKVESVTAWTLGGPRQWEELRTKGSLGKANGPFAIDNLTLPFENPWSALFFASGHDFLSNGDALLATIHGDLWLVIGIDDSLKELTWKRFATGLYQPLGVKVVDDKIYVLERDQITRLHDLNQDGQADYYENFNNECISTGGGHSYATCLETDPHGNFYFLKCAENTPHGGALLKVPKNGEGIEVLATGFRNPNGMGISPEGVITAADQQGDWVPETRLDVIQSGGFYGFTPMHKRAKAPESFDAPLCWIPRELDNSAGGQVWVPEGSWGALEKQMLHLSYGRCTMMGILRDGNNPGNGGIVPLPGKFLSGVMRGRFNPRDKHLYLSGLRGWQTAAIKDGCFQRVRYTGGPLLRPVSFSTRTNGIELQFDAPLDAETANDPTSYNAQQWNYRWSSRYGSLDYSVSSGKEGRDTIEITKAELLKNGKSVFLKMGLTNANVVKISYNLEGKGQEQIRGDFYCTINSTRVAENAR